MELTRSTPPLHLVHAPGSPLASVVALAHRIGASGANALVTGESGTGRETVARLVHAAGIAPESRFVVVQCRGRDEHTIAQEIFGPGTGSPDAGALSTARDGTLFLEDVAELPFSVQGRLVRWAVDGGAGARNPVVRVVGATDRDLLAEVTAGRFRRDLYDALACPLHIPPLRERRDDILAVFDRAWACVGNGRVASSAARELMRQYAWPGNVREVDGCTRRLAATAAGVGVTARDVERQLLAAATGIAVWALDDCEPRAGGHGSEVPELARAGVNAGISLESTEPIDLTDVLRRVESGLIQWALARTHGNKSAAAELLGVRRTTLVEKIRRLNDPTEGVNVVTMPSRAIG